MALGRLSAVFQPAKLAITPELCAALVAQLAYPLTAQPRHQGLLMFAGQPLAVVLVQRPTTSTTPKTMVKLGQRHSHSQTATQASITGTDTTKTYLVKVRALDETAEHFPSGWVQVSVASSSI